MLSRLAWPVILAEMGWIPMGIVDTVIVGPLGPAAIGAVGTGSTIVLRGDGASGMGTFYAFSTRSSRRTSARDESR